jgi:16S rRNA G1207 methylase RsmC
VEISAALREILEAKGFEVLSTWDFLDLEPEGKYDRIVANPPFGNGDDIRHVRHAFEHLATGGRMVTIVGEGAFIRSDKAATEFRAWLDEIGATEERLPEGSFKDTALLATTGANARIVIVDR